MNTQDIELDACEDTDDVIALCARRRIALDALHRERLADAKTINEIVKDLISITDPNGDQDLLAKMCDAQRRLLTLGHHSNTEQESMCPNQCGSALVDCNKDCCRERDIKGAMCPKCDDPNKRRT